MNFLTHFLNLGRSLLVAVYTVPGPLSWCMSKSLYLSKFVWVWYHKRVCLAYFCLCELSEAVAPLLDNRPYVGQSSRFWLILPPWRPKQHILHSSFSSMTTSCLPCPTIQHGNLIFRPSRHVPRICRRHAHYTARHHHATTRESVVVTLRPENIISVFFRPSFALLIYNITSRYDTKFRSYSAANQSQTRDSWRICRRHVCRPLICLCVFFRRSFSLLIYDIMSRNGYGKFSVKCVRRS